MATYYYNGAQIVTPFSIFSNEPVYHSDTVSLKIQRTSSNQHRWEISFNTVLTKDTQVDGLLNSIVGTADSQTMIMPQLPEVMELFDYSGPGNIDIAASASVGATLIYIDGSTVSGLIPKGMFIKFSSHDKVYIVTEDCDLTSSGTIAMSIFPSLRENITPAQAVKLDSDCVFKYYKDISNQSGITFKDGVLSDTGKIYLIEGL